MGRADAHQARAGAVHRCRLQRLALNGELEEQIQHQAEDAGGDDDQDRLAGDRDTGHHQREIGQALGPYAFRAEEDETHAGQREMQCDRDDE
jgi:hypothetical protein